MGVHLLLVSETRISFASCTVCHYKDLSVKTNNSVIEFWYSLFEDDPNYPDITEDWITGVSWMGWPGYENCVHSTCLQEILGDDQF